MAQLQFGTTYENIITRDEFSLERARSILSNEIIAVLGYGVQGPAQALNLRDNGFRVIVGQEKKFIKDWQRAIDDGWKENESLFNIEQAAEKASIIMLLVSDAAQPVVWDRIKPYLHNHDALYFSHGFSIVYSDQTFIHPAQNLDVILVAPKGSGTSVRRNFLNGSGVNSSYAIHHNASGKAEERCLALGIGIGSGYLFPTTFQKEVYSDLTGERGVLMGALAGLMEAQYEVLRKNGHSPSEAFNETVEELTQSLIRLVDENGMDWMYANCSATAQRGALDWKSRFKASTLPVFHELYEAVKNGSETKRVLQACGQEDYQKKLDAELSEMGNTELWQTGKIVRQLRPKQTPLSTDTTPHGTTGRAAN